ncbi:MAG: acyltransferase [Lachnospirales bacterium]
MVEKIISFSKAGTYFNTVIVDSSKSELLDKAEIVFNGENNILYVEDGVKLKNSKILFNGNNSIVYLSKSKYTYYTKITLYSDSIVYFGKDCSFNTKGISLLASEHQNILIGNNGLFSFGINFRTADAHLVYDCKTKLRLNQSKSILIGDRVWLGQNITILKGTTIGSGSIIGLNSLISNKIVFSNTICAGNPVKLLKDNMFFSNKSVHKFTDKDINDYKSLNVDMWSYQFSKDSLSLKDIDKKIKHKKNSYDKLNVLKEYIIENYAKNRFYIGLENINPLKTDDNKTEAEIDKISREPKRSKESNDFAFNKNNVETFKEAVAPTLNISKRFVIDDSKDKQLKVLEENLENSNVELVKVSKDKLK